MKHVWLALACLCFPSASRAVEIEQMKSGTFTTDVVCDVRIDYGGMFVRNNQIAMDKILALIVSSSHINRIRKFVAGRECEVAYCLTANDPPSKEQVYKDLVLIAPIAPNPKTPDNALLQLPEVPVVSKR